MGRVAWPWRPAARRPGPVPAAQMDTRPAPAPHRDPGPEAASLDTSNDATRNAPGRASDPHAQAARRSRPCLGRQEIKCGLASARPEMKGRVIKEGRRLAAVRSGDPGLHGARGLGLSWAVGLVPTLAGGGGGRRGPLTGPSLLGAQPWLSTPGWCTRAATRMPHGWPTHPEHASRRAVPAGPGREHATANRHADAQLAVTRGDARRVRDRADTRGRTHGTHTGSQATGRAPCSCCPMGTRPCSPVASAPDAEGRTAGPRGLGLAPAGVQGGDASTLRATAQRA